jgi:RimJ/RimL family protein N-acetyltransferase
MQVEQLITRRLLMRRLKKKDLPLILAWSNSEVAYGSYLSPERYTCQVLEELFSCNAFWKKNNKTFLIESRQTGQSIGTIHYWFRESKTDTAVISVKIAAPEERGKGYGTEAQKFLIIHLFEYVQVKMVDMYSDIGNLSQQRCLKKLGFSIVVSLTYDDHQVVRTGHLFRLTLTDYQHKAIYRFHYE